MPIIGYVFGNGSSRKQRLRGGSNFRAWGIEKAAANKMAAAWSVH